MTVDGVLIANKPRGPTSHDVVATARRLFRTRAVGHAGTLDPMASGVLVLLFGEATKLAAYLTLDDKEYRATVTFGRSTDTLDAEGETVVEEPPPPGFLSDGALERALDVERARTEQVPPSYSAVSVDGERAHRRSRRGETVVLPARPVAVRSATVLGHTELSVTIELSVSKGYYVRSFARDLGTALGVPAHLSALERTASGPFRLPEAAPWPPASPPELIAVADAARRSMGVAELVDEGVARARVGKRLAPEHFAEPPEAAVPMAWIDAQGGLVALGGPDGEGGFRVIRGFPNPQQPIKIT